MISVFLPLPITPHRIRLKNLFVAFVFNFQVSTKLMKDVVKEIITGIKPILTTRKPYASHTGKFYCQWSKYSQDKLSIG